MAEFEGKCDVCHNEVSEDEIAFEVANVGWVCFGCADKFKDKP